MTSTPRTLIDLAAAPDLEELFESAIYASSNTLPWLKDRLRSSTYGTSGTARLRQLVDSRSSRRERPDSLFEARVKRLLKKAKLGGVHHYRVMGEPNSNKDSPQRDGDFFPSPGRTSNITRTWSYDDFAKHLNWARNDSHSNQKASRSGTLFTAFRQDSVP